MERIKTLRGPSLRAKRSNLKIIRDRHGPLGLAMTGKGISGSSVQSFGPGVQLLGQQAELAVFLPTANCPLPTANCQLCQGQTQMMSPLLVNPFETS